MFYRVLLKKFSIWFTTITFLLSWIVVNFSLPFSIITMSSNHEVYASTDNGHTHIVFHHSEKHSHHKIIDDVETEKITLKTKENKKAHHDHLLHISNQPDITLNQDLDLNLLYDFSDLKQLSYVKIFDYSFTNTKLLKKEVNFSPQNEDTISKSLKTIILTI